MSYRLQLISGIIRLVDMAYIPADENNVDYQEYLKWIDEGNVPQLADTTALPTPEQVIKQTEIIESPITAKQYFTSKQAAIDFIRLTPAEQETQIDAMTLAQLKTVVKYLTIAVSAFIKERFL